MVHNAQSLCTQLTANDPDLTFLNLSIGFEEEGVLLRIFEAVQNNVTLHSLLIQSGDLSIRSLLALHAALCSHPNIQKLSFDYVSFTELSPIVLAVIHNDRLTSLSFLNCSVPSKASMMESLHLLLHDNALESLTVQACSPREDPVRTFLFDLPANTLINAQRLVKLRVQGGRNRTMAMSWKTALDLANLLQSNQGMQVLDLWNISLTSDMVRCIAQAATGHSSLQELTVQSAGDIDQVAGQAVGTMISNTPGLRELTVNQCLMGPVTACRVLEGIRSEQCMLEVLEFRGNNMGDDGAVALGTALETNGTVKKLFLSDNNIGVVGASALATALTKNETLEHMFAMFNNFGPEGTTAIADALHSNHSMKWINLQRNGMGDDGAVAVARMLRINTSLSGLEVGDFGERGLNAFIVCLPQMQGLLDLTIDDVHGFTTDTANALVGTLEQNTVLRTLDLNRISTIRPPPHPAVVEIRPRWDHPAVVEILPKVGHFLALNRAGRRYLKATTTPRSYWPYILAKSTNKPNVLYHFVREVPPNVLFSSARMKKRKRDTIWSSLWDSTRDLFGLRKRLRRN